VLTALASGPQHGYGILRDMQELSGGKVSPPVGSLYRAIDNLFRDGLIEEDSNEVVDGRFRRYYRLTVDGRDELAGAAATMQAVAAQARRRLRATPATVRLKGARA
jgi:DNA-binding PadR family transcriptional regulator